MTDKCCVTVYENKEYKYSENVDKGTFLYTVLDKHGIYMDFPCGRKGKCKKCTVLINGKEELACQFIIDNDICVDIGKNQGIATVSGITETFNFSGKGCLVLDIGTTTLALALVSEKTKQVAKVITQDNTQRKYGADVITRIDFCSKGGLEQLNAEIISDFNVMIDKLKQDFDLSEIESLYISGNTTMLHLFFNVECSAMGVSPYTPAFLESRCESSDSLGVNLPVKVISLPCVDSFVGSDIVAGLNLINTVSSTKYRILVDLGTNAEIVLFSNSEFLCTSAAAGPCFEGANISCGMSATDGAIDTFSIKDHKNTYTTINNKKAKGICGTGLIDIIQQLSEKEIIDETGYMENEKFEITTGIYLSQEDIRQFQLAKSAVISAIETLLKIKNLNYYDIEKLYISGGFSAKINIDKAVDIGLLPKQLVDKCCVLNNSSLLGSIKYTLEKNNLNSIIKKAIYIDLSANKDFSQKFVDNLYFN